MQGFVNARHQGMELNATSGVLTFQGHLVSPQRVLELLDAPVEVVAATGSSFTLQTIHKDVQAVPKPDAHQFLRSAVAGAECNRPHIGATRKLFGLEKSIVIVGDQFNAERILGIRR